MKVFLVIILYLFSVIKENQSDLLRKTLFFFIFLENSFSNSNCLLEGKTIIGLTSHFKFILSIHNFTLILNSPLPFFVI